MQDKRNIQESISARLQHSDPVREALKRLASQGLVRPDVIKAMATNDKTPLDSRIDAVTVVLAMERGGEEVLSRLLDTEDRTVFVEVLKVIATLHTNWALPELMIRLKTCANPEKRALFAWALAAYPNADDVESLLREMMATDHDATVREHAIESLGAFKSDEATNALLSVLETGTATERFWSLYSLGNIARPETTNAIRKHLQDHTVIPGFGTISEEARKALTKITNRGKPDNR